MRFSLVQYQGNLILSTEQYEHRSQESCAEDEIMGEPAAEQDSSTDTIKVEVVAVQALFGPFFSSLIDKPFDLIYVPHEFCPSQCMFNNSLIDDRPI